MWPKPARIRLQQNRLCPEELLPLFAGEVALPDGVQWYPIPVSSATSYRMGTVFTGIFVLLLLPFSLILLFDGNFTGLVPLLLGLYAAKYLPVLYGYTQLQSAVESGEIRIGLFLTPDTVIYSDDPIDDEPIQIVRSDIIAIQTNSEPIAGTRHRTQYTEIVHTMADGKRYALRVSMTLYQPLQAWLDG